MRYADAFSTSYARFASTFTPQITEVQRRSAKSPGAGERLGSLPAGSDPANRAIAAELSSDRSHIEGGRSASTRACSERERDQLGPGLIRREDAQAGGGDRAAGRRRENSGVHNAEPRGSRLSVRQRHKTRRWPAEYGPASQLVPGEVDREQEREAVQRAGVPGKVGEVQLVEGSACCPFAIGIQPDNKARGLAQGRGRGGWASRRSRGG
jgi:hypothetical protein